MPDVDSPLVWLLAKSQCSGLAIPQQGSYHIDRRLADNLGYGKNKSTRFHVMCLSQQACLCLGMVFCLCGNVSGGIGPEISKEESYARARCRVEYCSFLGLSCWASLLFF